MIDTPTHQRLLDASADARKSGRSFIEVLDERDLLLTPAVRRLIQVAALEALAVSLEEAPTSQIMAAFAVAVYGSPAETHKAILEYVNLYINGVKEGKIP